MPRIAQESGNQTKDGVQYSLRPWNKKTPQRTSLNSWICAWSNIAKTFDVARATLFLTVFLAPAAFLAADCIHADHKGKQAVRFTRIPAAEKGGTQHRPHHDGSSCHASIYSTNNLQIVVRCDSLTPLDIEKQTSDNLTEQTGQRNLSVAALKKLRSEEQDTHMHSPWSVTRGRISGSWYRGIPGSRTSRLPDLTQLSRSSTRVWLQMTHVSVA